MLGGPHFGPAPDRRSEAHQFEPRTVRRPRDSRRTAASLPTGIAAHIAITLGARRSIWNQRQLERLVVDFIDHYNTHRPHRSLNQRAPTTAEPVMPATPLRQLDIARSTRCDGLIHEYRNAA